MARIRTVKPDLFVDDGLFETEVGHALPPFSARFVFIGLFTQADREGRFKWRPRRLATQITPYDGIDIEPVLNALAADGYLVKYEVDGKTYGAITGWKEHQRTRHDEAASVLPAPTAENTVEALQAKGPQQLVATVTNPSLRSDESALRSDEPVTTQRGCFPRPIQRAASRNDSEQAGKGHFGKAPVQAEGSQQLVTTVTDPSLCSDEPVAWKGREGKGREGKKENSLREFLSGKPDDASVDEKQISVQKINLPSETPDCDLSDDREGHTSGTGKGTNVPNSASRTPSRRRKKDSIPYERIIGFVNKFSGRKYRHQTERYRRIIRGRWSEGHREGDFERVCENMAHWLDDPKMADYFQPSTLFAASHFDEYLNRKPKQAPRKPRADRRIRTVFD